VGIIARVIKHTFDKFVTLTGETRKDFNFNTLLYTPAGDDSIPLKDERLILAKVDGTGKYVTVGVLTPSQGAKPGEKIFFARNEDGEIVSKMSFLNDGTVLLEADGDVTVKTKKNHITNADENIKQTAKKDLTSKAKNITGEAEAKNTIKGADVEINGKTEITGGTLKCKGTAAPTGLGCFCAKPFCIIDGSPHIGEMVTAT